MKILKYILTLAALFAVVTVANAQTNVAQPAAQLTPANVADINNLLPLLPATWQPLIVKVLAILGTLGVIGRVIIGFKNGGLFGVITGLLGGTNTPKTADTTQLSQGAAASKLRGLSVLLCLALPCLILTGCGSIPHQYVDNESGTGLKAKIPVGYNGNNIFELDLTVGTFKHTSMVQPVETNRVYSPDLVVAESTRGKFTANPMNVGTNTVASVTGGDAYAIATGHAALSVTNDADISAKTWQDAPPSQSK